MCHSSIISYTSIVYWLLRTILQPQDVYCSNVLEDEDVIGSSVTDARGGVFPLFLQWIQILAHTPNIFLGIILPQNCCQNVCDLNGLENRTSIG